VPVYDYLCSACGRVTEVIHGIHAPEPRFCPACGAEGTLTKAFAAPAVHFKGSGWAKKDRSTARTKVKSTSDGTDGSGAPPDTAAAGATEGASGATSANDDGASSKKAKPIDEPKARASGARTED
jgi:putative FmdB family regulatory protein